MVSGHPAIRFRAALRTGIPRESPFLSVFCRLSAPRDHVIYPAPAGQIKNLWIPRKILKTKDRKFSCLVDL